MKKIIFYLAITFFISCEKSLEPNITPNIQANPIVISYNEEKEEYIQNEWDKFLTYYHTIPDTSYTYFGKSTSYIMQTYFKENLPQIFSNPNDDSLSEMELFQFYSKWKELFGCNENNIEFKIDSNEVQTFFIKLKQKRIGNAFYEFVYQPFIKFGLTENMQIKNIVSTLIPDVEIEIPQDSDWINITKMINTTIGLEYEFHPDASSIYFPQKHLFSETDTYHVKDGFEIFDEYYENTLSIYYLKGIEYFWYEDNIEYKCTVYYHPSTTEIIHIKKW